ncbi:hypothetical protein BHE74_00031790 [Ensete ventricosum]|nr:hypothetical protein GW17_00060022 [Ensete ventricosum]RWW61168.1 hypothetical protein BHE74_00031790 [Ensete ventricosum]
MKQPAQAIGKKPAEEHLAGIEDAKQSGRGSHHPSHTKVAAVALSTPIAEAVITLSTLELPWDRRAAVNPTPIVAQPPPFLALESIPHLGEKSRHPFMPEITDFMPRIADH